MIKTLVYPTFLYVGASKSGSSWIFECLREHPDVYVPIAKDLKYFDVGYEQGQTFDNYLGYFNNGQGKTAVGELSHDYFLKEEYAERIHSHLPNVKIIACLREPGSKVISGFNYSGRPEKQKGLKNYYENWYLPEGKISYLQNLQYFYDRFPEKNIKVIFFDDLKNSPNDFLFDLYDFLGVDPTYIPNVLHQKTNSARTFRFNNSVLHRTAFQIGQILRKFGLTSLVGFLKRNKLFMFLFFSRKKPRSNQGIQPQVASEIRNEAQKTYKELEALIGKKIPKDWYRA